MSTDTATIRTEVTTVDAAGNPLADLYVGTNARHLRAAIERAESAVLDPCSRVAGYTLNGKRAGR